MVMNMGSENKCSVGRFGRLILEGFPRRIPFRDLSPIYVLRWATLCVPRSMFCIRSRASARRYAKIHPPRLVTSMVRDKPDSIGFIASMKSMAEREGLPRLRQKLNKTRHFLHARRHGVYQSCVPKSMEDHSTQRVICQPSSPLY